jgi:hypothetical protein
LNRLASTQAIDARDARHNPVRRRRDILCAAQSASAKSQENARRFHRSEGSALVQAHRRFAKVDVAAECQAAADDRRAALANQDGCGKAIFHALFAALTTSALCFVAFASGDNHRFDRVEKARACNHRTLFQRRHHHVDCRGARLRFAKETIATPNAIALKSAAALD